MPDLDSIVQVGIPPITSSTLVWGNRPDNPTRNWNVSGYPESFAFSRNVGGDARTFAVHTIVGRRTAIISPCALPQTRPPLLGIPNFNLFVAQYVEERWVSGRLKIGLSLEGIRAGPPDFDGGPFSVGLTATVVDRVSISRIRVVPVTNHPQGFGTKVIPDGSACDFTAPILAPDGIDTPQQLVEVDFDRDVWSITDALARRAEAVAGGYAIVDGFLKVAPTEGNDARYRRIWANLLDSTGSPTEADESGNLEIIENQTWRCRSVSAPRIGDFFKYGGYTGQVTATRLQARRRYVQFDVELSRSVRVLT